jgi:hypothetical protein
LRKLSLQITNIQLLLLLLVLVHEGCEDLLLLGRVHLVKTLRNWVGVVLQLVRLFSEWLGGRRLRGLVARLRGPGTLRLCMVELGLNKGCSRSCWVGRETFSSRQDRLLIAFKVCDSLMHVRLVVPVGMRTLLCSSARAGLLPTPTHHVRLLAIALISCCCSVLLHIRITARSSGPTGVLL